MDGPKYISPTGWVNSHESSSFTECAWRRIRNLYLFKTKCFTDKHKIATESHMNLSLWTIFRKIVHHFILNCRALISTTLKLSISYNILIKILRLLAYGGFNKSNCFRLKPLEFKSFWIEYKIYRSIYSNSTYTVWWIPYVTSSMSDSFQKLKLIWINLTRFLISIYKAQFWKRLTIQCRVP